MYIIRYLFLNILYFFNIGILNIYFNYHLPKHIKNIKINKFYLFIFLSVLRNVLTS